MSANKSRRRMGLLVGTLVVLGGFTYLLSGGISDNLVYFFTPDELLAKGAEVVDDPIRLGGVVAPGSVEWNAQALDLRFRVTDETGREVPVHASNAPPQMFREGIGVIVEGRMTAAGVFEATNLMVKHSNEYRAPDEGHDPEKMYRTLVREPGS